MKTLFSDTMVTNRPIKPIIMNKVFLGIAVCAVAPFRRRSGPTWQCQRTRSGTADHACGIYAHESAARLGLPTLEHYRFGGASTPVAASTLGGSRSPWMGTATTAALSSFSS